jgi:hypothetical protein
MADKIASLPQNRIIKKRIENEKTANKKFQKEHDILIKKMK